MGEYIIQKRIGHNDTQRWEDCSEEISTFEKAASQMIHKENWENYRIIKVAVTFEYEASQKMITMWVEEDNDGRY